jgi:hypothetical protein
MCIHGPLTFDHCDANDKLSSVLQSKLLLRLQPVSWLLPSFLMLYLLLPCLLSRSCFFDDCNRLVFLSQRE